MNFVPYFIFSVGSNNNDKGAKIHRSNGQSIVFSGNMTIASKVVKTSTVVALAQHFAININKFNIHLCNSKLMSTEISPCSCSGGVWPYAWKMECGVKIF